MQNTHTWANELTLIYLEEKVCKILISMKYRVSFLYSITSSHHKCQIDKTNYKLEPQCFTSSLNFVDYHLGKEFIYPESIKEPGIRMFPSTSSRYSSLSTCLGIQNNQINEFWHWPSKGVSSMCHTFPCLHIQPEPLAWTETKWPIL